MQGPAPDHVPLVQSEFKGLYSRGVSDSVPPAFFIDCLNNKFGENEVSSRDGTVLNLTASNVVRFSVYKRLNETPRFIYLDTSGSLWDSLYPTIPIFTDADFVDFSMVNYANRAYITAHNRLHGIAGKSLLVYDGSGTARAAAGVAPTGFTLGVAESASSGKIEAGIHLFAVAFITSTGFISAPGPDIFATLTATGGFSADLSNIGLGGPSVIGRVILSTKAIPISLFTGNLFGYELFFIPNATITDNTTTTYTASFYDADLLDSADYLLDNLSSIPAGLGVFVYNGRLGTWADNGNEYTVRLSSTNDPESFSNVDGFFTIDPSDGGNGVRNIIEFRKNLYVFESNRIFVTSDNGGAPSTWQVDVVDKSSGTECFGISQVLDARGLNNERVWIADRSGLVVFTGNVVRPELTFNIEDVWKRINKIYFNLIQVIDDPTNHRILVSVPLDSATAISHVLYADYSKAFTVYGTIDHTAVKWSIWTFPSAVKSMAGDVDATTELPIIHFALASNIYDLKTGITNDFSTAITSFFRTSLKAKFEGWINHFGYMRLRVVGGGTLATTLYSEDGVNPTSGPSFSLSSTPGLEPDSLINYFNEKMSVKLGVTSIDDHYTVSRVDIWAKEMWLRRPQ